MGGLKGEDHDKATDKNLKFVEDTNTHFNYVFSPYETIPKLRFPLVEKMFGKFEAVEWALKHGNVTQHDLIKTSSCLSGEDGNCGHCVVCLRRWGIYKQLGFSEQYNKSPLTGKDNILVCIDMLKSELQSDYRGYYDVYRRKEIIGALEIEFTTLENALSHFMEIQHG